MGFAWDVFGDGSTSLRSGFGLLYHLGSFGAIRVTSADGIPPFGSRSTVTSNVRFPRTVIPPEAVGKEISVAPDYHMQQPHVLQYHLTIDRQLPASMVVSVSYAGSRGINLFEAQDGNPTVPTRVNGREFWTGTDPRINPNWGFVELRTTGADSWYNSLQFGLQKRLSHGLQFQSSYTYSKVLDTPQGQQNSGESGGGNRNAYGVNPSNRKYDKGPADFDHAHVWAFNLLEQLPSPGLPGIGRILDGWRVGSIVKIQTGQRFTPILSGNRSRSQVQNGSQNDRPDLVPGRKPDDIILGGANRYFDPTAFVVQPAGFLGTASRNMLTGPGQINVDFSITKHFPLRGLGEGTGLEFRTEIFNLFNRANFFIPINGAQVYTGTATVPAPTATSATPLATAGQIVQTLGTSRQLQFALKLIF